MGDGRRRREAGGRHGDFVLRVPPSGPVEGLRLARDVAVSPSVFFQRYGDVYGLASDDEMVPYASGQGAPGFAFTRYRQQHRGLPVFGATVVVTHRDDRVVSALGAVATKLPDDTKSEIKPQAAIRAAVETVARRSKRRSEQLRVSPDPSCELGFAGIAGTRRLCYRVVVSADVPVGRHRVDVDAKTGEPLWILSSMRFFVTTKPAWGTSLYNGYVTFLADQDSQNGWYQLTEQDGYPVKTRDAHGTNDPASAWSISSSDEIFNGTDAATIQGVSAHWCVERSLEYFEKRFQRNGIDGNGIVVTNLVQAVTADSPDEKGSPAAFNLGTDGLPYLLFRGDLPAAPISLDTVAHEFTHGVASYSAGFDPFYYESGALDECFADTFGAAVEFATTPQTANWQMGEDWVSLSAGANASIALRSLQDPKFGCGDSLNYTGCQPTTYLHDPWVTPVGSPAPTDDVWKWNHAHTNSGVGNFCFYLLSESGKGTNDNGDPYDVLGIGIDDAARIAYLNLTSKLNSQSGYVQAAAGAIDAATELFGEFSQGRISTQNAWYAVGVSAQYAETPHVSPVGVTDPWPAKFEWEQGIAEDAWVVQVSETADFSTGVQEFPADAGSVEVIAGTPCGTLKVPLKPGTKYWWRVRNANAQVSATAAIAPWRPVQQISTDAKKVKLLSPRTVTSKGSRMPSGVAYPWRLEFSWKGFDEADGYEIEVTDSVITDPSTNQLVPDWTKLIFPSVETVPPYSGNPAPTHQPMTVKVKSWMHWRARALSPEGAEYAGVWSDPFRFKTSWPNVTISKPANGAYPYPWPVTLQWKKVEAAAKYKVEIDRSNKGQWGVDSQKKKLEFDQPTTGDELSVDLNLKPRLNSDQEAHTWKVRVWGPPLGWPALGTGEEGQDSGWYTFYNGGSKTAPHYAVPFDAEVGESGALWTGWMVHNSGGDVYWSDDLHWGKVDAATEYHLYLRPWDETTGPGGNALLPKVLVDPAHPPQHPQIKIRTDQEDMQPPPGVGVEAYRWDAWAIGPEDLKGLSTDDAFHKTHLDFIEPDVPVPINPPKDGTGVDPANLVFSFTSEYTPSGKYRVQLQGQNLHEATIPGNPGAETSFGLGALGVSPSSVQQGTTYQWRVRAFSDHTDIDDQYPWGPWWKFTTAAPKPPPPAPTLICPSGGQQIPGTSVYFAWSEIPGATQYEFVITPPPYFSSTGDITYTLNDLDIANGAVLLDLGYDTFDVNVQYQWMVRAYVNGVWSDMSPPATFVTGPSHEGDRNNECAAVVQGP
jgi:Zn-dependent metalloprotease